MIFPTFSNWAGRSPHFFQISLITGLGVFALFVNPIAQAQSVAVVEECNQFADNVNRNQTILQGFEAEINTFSQNAAAAETLEDITAAASQYVEAVEDVTDNLATLADDLERLTITDTQLSSFRNDYVAVVAGFNTALGRVSEAMAGVAVSETEDELATSLATFQDDTVEAVEQIEILATRESDIIDDVNGYCGAE